MRARTDRSAVHGMLIVGLVVGASGSAQAWNVPPMRPPAPHARMWQVPSCEPQANKRTVKLTFAPDTSLEDLIAWIAMSTCKTFLLPGTIPADQRVTVIGPELITPEEAYRLFLGAVESLGLTVEKAGRFLRIVETARIETMGGQPIFADSAASFDVPERYVTLLLRREQIDRDELLRLMRPLPPSSDVWIDFEPRDPVVMTDVESNIRPIIERIRLRAGASPAPSGD